MDSFEAREHLEMVDRILAHADRTLQPRGALFIIWGVVIAAFDLMWQAAVSYPQFVRPWWLAIGIGIWLAAVAFTMWYVGRSRCEGRLTVIERQWVRVLYITVACGIVCSAGGWNIFEHWAAGAIWTVMYAIPVLFIGVQGHRYAMAGGVVLLASIVVANFTPNGTGAVLAVGALVGYAGLGVAFEVERASTNG